MVRVLTVLIRSLEFFFYLDGRQLKETVQTYLHFLGVSSALPAKNNTQVAVTYKLMSMIREGLKKKLEKSGQADRLGRLPLPRSGQENVKNYSHIWGYLAIL